MVGKVNIRECQHESCRNSLKPWNAATNFPNPAFSIKSAMDTGIIAPSMNVLEFGAGNLRNALYVMRTLPNIEYSIVEMKEVSDRFQDNYSEFVRIGGHLLQNDLDGHML
ncbi:hypothetical protein ACFLTK_02465 [Chloroflexota bacterium]